MMVGRRGVLVSELRERDLIYEHTMAGALPPLATAFRSHPPTHSLTTRLPNTCTGNSFRRKTIDSKSN